MEERIYVVLSYQLYHSTVMMIDMGEIRTGISEPAGKGVSVSLETG